MALRVFSGKALKPAACLTSMAFCASPGVRSSRPQGFTSQCASPTTRRSMFKEATRSLSLHEYQSKDLLEKFGLNVQPGSDAETPEQVYTVAKRLLDAGAGTVVLKCQILAGGRGKGSLSSGLQGGVKFAKTPAEARELARQMLGYRLVTHQTTAEGEFVKKILVVNAANVQKELYLALLMDRANNGPVAIVSQMGGVDIEDVAAKNPSAIKTHPINITKGMTDQDAVAIARNLGLTEPSMMQPAVEQLKRMYKLFIESDATQVEINPLAIVKEPSGKLAVRFVDAKLSFDDFASYRQKELFAQEDKDTVDPRELAAEKAGLNFVGLDGNVGCLVNGAGLAMATMDIINLHGASPANFLDVGGGADENQVRDAFKILQSDKNVKVIFVNIFGGIMRCDIIAQGLVSAAKQVGLTLPLIVRLVGNRVEIGKQIIKDANLPNIKAVDDFESAAQAVVAAVPK